ncbi:hypothetical protein D3C80_1305690 [compost metagenome]
MKAHRTQSIGQNAATNEFEGCIDTTRHDLAHSVRDGAVIDNGMIDAELSQHVDSVRVSGRRDH